MKLIQPFFLILCFWVAWGASVLQGQELDEPRTIQTRELALTPEGEIPGISLAQGITQITGVAISPLWGMSVLGAWKYWHTAPELREQLPWYCHHTVWGTCFVILAMSLLKDVLGASVPALIKKPFDFVELFEDKLSAIVASGAFVPLVAAAMAQYQQIPDQASNISLASAGMAVIPGLGQISQSGLHYLVLMPLSIAGFAVVWLASHSINVMIALSPFGLIDATLKLFKGALLTLVAVLSAIHPYLGLLICIPLILIAIPVSGWAFRLSSFGAAVGLDLLLRKRAKTADLEPLRGFSGNGMAPLPPRTRGTLRRDEEGRLAFSYRPWLIGVRKTFHVPHQATLLEKGLLFDEVKTHAGEEEAKQWKSVFQLLPRYGTMAEKIAFKLQVNEVRETYLKKGVERMRLWIREIANLGKRKPVS